MPIRQNSIIAMLPPPVTQRLDAESQVVHCDSEQVLLDAGEPIVHVHFPIDAIVSIDQVIKPEGDDSISAPAVAIVGSEGVTGIEAFFGAESAISRSTVRIAGTVLRVDAAALQEEFVRAGAFHRVLLHFADALFAQVCGNAACERIHTIEQRLIRWLLLFDDRCDSHELALKQDTLAHLLAVRRVSISAAAVLLQLAGQITYHRGHIVLSDRAALETKACNCYRGIKSRYATYLQPEP